LLNSQILLLSLSLVHYLSFAFRFFSSFALCLTLAEIDFDFGALSAVLRHVTREPTAAASEAFIYV
jgi:hypothetical protein